MARGRNGHECPWRMIQRLPFSFEGIDGDIRRLGALLGEVFQLAELRFSGKLAVLNLACGRADETGVLAAAVAPAEIGFYLGMDLRGDAIEDAEKRWELPGGEIHFREGNAAMIGRMEGLPEFDIVFIRHQNYWHEPMVWEGILDEALAALKDGGVLVCTSYFDLEHELLSASMRERGATLLANLRNAFSRDLPDAEGKSVDRWVAVWGTIHLASPK
jgi:SAM-dependent methyltransferase